MERYPRNPEEFSDGRKKIVIADVSHDLEARANDIALDKATESTEKPKGILNRIKNFGANVWKRSEVFQTRERHKAQSEIQKTGRLYGESETANQAEVDAITRRFATSQEFEDEFIHKSAGESREQLGNSEAETRLKGQIQDLIRSYARGDLNDESFYTAKEQLFAEIKGLKPEAIDKGKMYVDNILQVARDAKTEVARQVEQSVAHEAAIQNLDLDFDVVIGKARAGVRSEAQFNAVDRIVDKIQRGTGGMLNEYAVASGVAIANTVFKTVVQGSVKRAASAFGLGMVATGAAAGLKESRKIEVERMQHAREMAQGKKVKDPANAERRQELEESRIQTKNVRELEAGLETGLFNKLVTKEAKDLTAEEYQEALKALADIDSRIQISDQGIVKSEKTSKWQFWKSEKRQGVDLIGYSDIEKVSQERDRLDVLRARAKVELKKYAAANGRNLNEDLTAGVNTVRQEIFAGDKGIEKQNEIFAKLKQQRVWSAVKRGALVGGAIGLAVQEVSAFMTDKEGAVEHGWHKLTGDTHSRVAGEHVTLAEGIRRRVTDYFEGAGPGPDFNNLHDQVVDTHKFKLPEGLNFQQDATGQYRIFENGNPITDPLHLNPDGSLAPDAKQYLRDHGFGLYDETSAVAGSAKHAMTLGETKAKFAGLGRHARVDWHDNPGSHYSSDHGREILFEGKQQNLYLEQAKDGTVSVDARRVISNLEENLRSRLTDPSFGQNPDGSFDQKLIHLRDQMLGWMNNGTLQEHMQVALIPTEAANQSGLSTLVEGATNGKIALPQEYSSLFTDPQMLRDGKLPIRFMELRIDGHVLATAKGGDIEIPDAAKVINTVIGKPGNPDFVTEPPYIIPFGSRKGLEQTTKPEAILPYTYTYYQPISPERVREYQERMSETLRNNPDAVLDADTEIASYFREMDPERLEHTRRLAEQAGPINPEVRMSVAIPVAGHQEGENIYRSLENYTNQTLDRSKFEVVLFVNHPDRDRSGNVIRPDQTLSEIERFKKDYPDFNVRVIYEVLPIDEAKIGNIRKYITDAVLLRQLERGKDVPDLIIVSNDADNRGVARRYLENFLQKFEQFPETDGFMGQLDWDIDSYNNNPMMHIGTRFFQFVDAQIRKSDPLRVQSSGANFAMRASIYAAVRGYNVRDILAEDRELGDMIKSARMDSDNPDRQAIRFAGAVVSRLYTSSRRALKALDEGKAPIEQWNSGFSAFDDEVRKYKMAESGIDFNDPEQANAFVQELERIINRTLKVIHGADNKYWATGYMGNETQQALRLLGIKYEIDNGNIRITEASRLIDGLKNYKNESLTTRKIKLEGKGDEEGESAEDSDLPEKIKADFEERPLSFIYGRDFSRVKERGIGLGRFMEGARTYYGISAEQYEQIKDNARLMKARRGFSGAQRELALMIREATKNNPRALNAFRSSTTPKEYERWVMDVIGFETKNAVAAKTLSEDRINSLAVEYGINPEVVISAAVANQKDLTETASRRYVEQTTRRTNPLPKTAATRSAIDREVLREYQQS